MRGRFSCWIVATMLVAGCSAPAPKAPTATDQIDVWFMQHMVPHLRETASILDLARDRITSPRLTRLAEAIDQQQQAHLEQLQGWLDRRGLAAHVHSHHGIDGQRRQTHLERLSRVRGGAAFDLAFIEVMTALQRAGSQLAATEARDGSVPEVRRLAQQLLAEQRAQVNRMRSWRTLLNEAGRSSPLAGLELRPR